MTQSAILRVSYEAVYADLLSVADRTKLFTVSAKGSVGGPEDQSPPVVCLGVSDISQLYLDKNGQIIEVDEALFEAPTQVGYMLSLTVIADAYPPLLEAVGALIQHFKDNNAIQLADYKWHGENEGKIFLEPVIREPQPRKSPAPRDSPALTLEYRVEMGINSLKGASFKRVEKTAIKGNLIDQ